MSNVDIGLRLLDGFYYRDASAVLKKLRSFASAGADALHVVSDFDLTLTAGKRAGQNIGTWDVLDELMPAEGVARHTAIYESFRPIELQGKLTSEIAREKWSETLDLITSYDIHVDDIRDAFLAVAQLREGAKQLFDACQSRSIPTVVLSSGIRNVIRIMAEHYQIYPTHILSNDLEFDEITRLVTGWRPDSLIHMLNKKEMGHSELSALRKTRPNVLLLGDVPDDVKMVDGDTVIRICVLDTRKGETQDLAQARHSSFAVGYDLVIPYSLQPVAELAEWLAKRHV